MATYAANLTSLETNLISQLRSSEEGAFQELFRHFNQKIFRTALRILKEEESAKDALQETMINIHRAAKTFRGEAKLATWINRITVNVCLEILRKNKKHSKRTSEDISEYLTIEDPVSKDPFTEAQRAEVRRRVHTALNRLTEKHRIVVRMHDLEGFTIREIAARVGVAEGTIKSRLFYGRDELKKQLIS
jgi:RNA polymerase sigma-70 factor (ECF subfamily)